MQRLTDRGMIVDLQILDSEASASYKRIITTKWEVAFQLAPPHIHRRNAAECAIRMLQAHFLSILARIADECSRNFWDLLLPQAVLTPNFLRQAEFEPKYLGVRISRGTLRLQY